MLFTNQFLASNWQLHMKHSLNFHLPMPLVWTHSMPKKVGSKQKCSNKGCHCSNLCTFIHNYCMSHFICKVCDSATLLSHEFGYLAKISVSWNIKWTWQLIADKSPSQQVCNRQGQYCSFQCWVHLYLPRQHSAIFYVFGTAQSRINKLIPYHIQTSGFRP